MPDTIEAELPKRGPGRPPLNPQPKSESVEEINWVTPEEAEKYEAMINRQFIRKRELNEGDNGTYFYRITSMCPYVPGGVVCQTHQHLVLFQVQKYYRNKMETRKRFEPGKKTPLEVKENVEVQWIETARMDMGTPRVLDADASFQMESREFEKVFVRDDR